METPEIPPCDILIHAGDLSYHGKPLELAKVNEWLASIALPKSHKIVIAGNHDIGLQKDPVNSRQYLSDCTYLQDTHTSVMGLKIYGSPYSPDFYPDNWAFNQPRGTASIERWNRIPLNTDIVVVHGPPFGYGDRVRNQHVGCVDLYRRLRAVRPSLTVCGHIHEDHGVFAAPFGTVVNAAIMDGAYKPNNKPILIDVPVFR